MAVKKKGTTKKKNIRADAGAVFTAKEARQKLFCEEYVKDRNATAAYRRAGYAAAAAEQCASRLLTNAKVKSYIAQLIDQRSERCQTDSDYVLQKLRVIADASIDQYVEFNGTSITFKDFKKLTPEQLQAIESIKHTRHGIELKLHGKSWTLEMIAKHIGFYEKDNRQKTPEAQPVDLSKLNANELNQFLQLQAKLMGGDG